MKPSKAINPQMVINWDAICHRTIQPAYLGKRWLTQLGGLKDNYPAIDHLVMDVGDIERKPTGFSARTVITEYIFGPRI